MNPAQDRSSLGEGKTDRLSRRGLAWGIHVLAWGLSVACSMTPTSGAGEGPVRIEQGLSPGPYYVGQEVEFSLRVEAGGERPSVAPFRVAGADVVEIGDGPASPGPVETDADDRGRDVHRFAFRIVPRRTGTLNIPTVAVRQRGLSASSRPVRFSVRPLPSGGRPRGFLGGVGPFRVEAEATPRAVRAGGEFEYRLRIIGPAARGSRDAPDLAPFDRVPLGLRVTSLPIEESNDPPFRVYRYRIRATRPGSAVLPPVTLASFDPKTAHYITSASPGIPIRVADPPSLNPAAVVEAPLPDSSTPRGRPALRRVVGRVSGFVATLAALTGLGLFVKRRRMRGRAGRFVARLARRLDSAEGAAETARRITEGLATYLKMTADRPPGVLTPDEAAQAVEGLTERPDLAEGARRLMVHCDRARYSEDGTDVEELVAEAKCLFRGLQQEVSRAGEVRRAGGGVGWVEPKRGSRDRESKGVVRSKTASP